MPALVEQVCESRKASKLNTIFEWRSTTPFKDKDGIFPDLGGSKICSQSWQDWVRDNSSPGAIKFLGSEIGPQKLHLADIGLKGINGHGDDTESGYSSKLVLMTSVTSSCWNCPRQKLDLRSDCYIRTIVYIGPLITGNRSIDAMEATKLWATPWQIAVPED